VIETPESSAESSPPIGRFRWRHAVFLLASAVAIVVLVSLEMHRRTLESVARLIESSERMDEHLRRCKRIEQCILELNAPASDVLGAVSLPREQERFRLANERLQQAVDAAADNELPLDAVKKRIDTMAAGVRVVFSKLAELQDPRLSAEARADALADASSAMLRRDREQLQAMREMSVLSDRVRANHNNVLDGHEAGLQTRLRYERYFIAAVVALLAGVIWFGLRLESVDRALHEERHRAAQERRERLAAIGELCSGVAHGFRNPLAAIRSSAQLTLELGQLDDASRSRLDDILSESGRLGDRVNGLLSLARASSEAFESVPLQEVVAAAIRSVEPEGRRLGLNVQQHLDARDIVLSGDRRQLEQLVIELLSNALERTPRGGTISVQCARPRDNGSAEISVKDDGPGIPPEIRERVFDLFFTTKPGGTGIGLASVMRIARLHGGRAYLDAAETGGARFVVLLPVSTQPA